MSHSLARIPWGRYFVWLVVTCFVSLNFPVFKEHMHCPSSQFPQVLSFAHFLFLPLKALESKSGLGGSIGSRINGRKRFDNAMGIQRGQALRWSGRDTSEKSRNGGDQGGRPGRGVTEAKVHRGERPGAVGVAGDTRHLRKSS